MPVIHSPTFQNLIKLLGENVSPSRIEKLIKEVDMDGDGMISFEEFLVIFRTDNNMATKEEFASTAHSEADASARSES